MTPLLAYLDPTTGSIVFQTAIGGIVAGLALVRIYWRRIKTLFKRQTSEPAASAPAAETFAKAARENGDTE